MEENMVAIREPKTFYFDLYLPKDADKNLRHEIEFLIKNNECLADNKIKNEIKQLLSKYKNGNDIHEHGNNKTNELHKFVLELTKRLDLRSSNKLAALQNVSIYYFIMKTDRETRSKANNSPLRN